METSHPMQKGKFKQSNIHDKMAMMRDFNLIPLNSNLRNNCGVLPFQTSHESIHRQILIPHVA